jgi:hypothetical protein
VDFSLVGADATFGHLARCTVLVVACELELDGIVAVLQTVVRDPEFEDRPFDKELWLREDIFSAVNGLVTAQFGGRIELSREVEIRRGSLVIVLTLITAGRVIIEYGALMQGLRELARLVPDRIRDVLGRRRPDGRARSNGSGGPRRPGRTRPTARR